MNTTVKDLFSKVADIHDTPPGAFNLRVNGRSIGMANSPNVSIVPKADGTGIDIHVKAGTRGETVHIPVAIDNSGLSEVVYNDFHIGEDCEDILIVAGCGIHNCGTDESRHDGIHSFYLGKNAKVTYREKHYGSGGGQGGRVLNPVTNVFLESGSHLDMESVQIEGVDSTRRVTKGVLGDDSMFTVTEKIMTSGKQFARTEFILDLDGKGSSARVVSRSVAKGASLQEFISQISGNNECVGHSECDAIIMDEAVVKAVPEITANHIDASLIHEAAIGKIAGEQLTKLMTLGLTAAEAEAQIINGFLK
ncbi:SufD family Fe-S cluster assembly protein [Desulfovibrio sp. OttesenSCG-928-A18]|nr:SufD family Fe-S cluster assembly protein [Desulfovibrio sp. OttesenSCG-928-A18]